MRAIIFDTETTGLIKSRFAPLEAQPHMVEFFGLALEWKARKPTKKDPSTGGWKEVATLGMLVNPGIEISAEITRITGIDNDMVKYEKKITDPDCYIPIANFLASGDIVVAHNLGFDEAIVDIDMKRASYAVAWPKRKICTVEGTEHLIGRRMKLIELHQHLFGEPFEGAHRAENDVRPLTRCFIELWNRGVFGK